jgi:hypothetical protein
VSSTPRHLRALFEFSERLAGKAAKLGRSGVEFFGVIGAARLPCGEPATKARESIWRQIDDGFGDFFNFHMAHSVSLSGLWKDDIYWAVGVRGHSRVCYR